MGIVAEFREFRARRLEQRNYSDMMLVAHQHSISKKSAPLSTAAVELASGMLGRALAAAEVGPPGTFADAADKSFRERVGRDLITQGEHLSLIELWDGRALLWPATSWTFKHGTPNPASWIVDAHIPSPDGIISVQRPWSNFVSLMWAPNPSQPWRGMSPIDAASISSRLAGNLEAAAAAEAGGPVGHLIPIPRVSDESISEMQQTLANIDGKSMLVESMTRGDNNSSNEYTTRRIGANPPASIISLRSDVERSMTAMMGMDVSLLKGGAAASRRESYRQWLHTVVSPIGERLETELRNKLMVPDLQINFSPLSASDMAGKARAAASLVKSGWTPEEAAEVVGIDPPSSTQHPAQEMLEQ